MTPLRTRLAASVLGAGLVIAVPAAAWAVPHRPGKMDPGATATTTDTATDTAKPNPAKTTASVTGQGRDLESLRSRCVAAIDVRLPRLSAAKAALASARHLTDDHRAALTGLIDDTATKLQTLRSEIQGATEAGTLLADCRSIFREYRVFALVLPGTRLVAASDVSVAAADKLDSLAGRLEAAIAQAEAAGRDMTQARSDLAAMKQKIASSRTSAASVAGAVLGLTAADWNANHNVLLPARQSLQSARRDLRAARDLAVKMRDALKAGPKA